jgi:hypothetical protein
LGILCHCGAAACRWSIESPAAPVSPWLLLGGIVLIILTVRHARVTWNQFLFSWVKSQHMEIAMVPYLTAMFTASMIWLLIAYISGERSRAYFSL